MELVSEFTNKRDRSRTLRCRSLGLIILRILRNLDAALFRILSAHGTSVTSDNEVLVPEIEEFQHGEVETCYQNYYIS